MLQEFEQFVTDPEKFQLSETECFHVTLSGDNLNLPNLKMARRTENTFLITFVYFLQTIV